MSNSVAFVNPNAPNYPRLAQGKTWDEVSLFFYQQGDFSIFVETIIILRSGLCTSYFLDSSSWDILDWFGLV